jgi:hypothetical protein
VFWYDDNCRTSPQEIKQARDEWKVFGGGIFLLFLFGLLNLLLQFLNNEY